MTVLVGEREGAIGAGATGNNNRYPGEFARRKAAAGRSKGDAAEAAAGCPGEVAFRGRCLSYFR